MRRLEINPEAIATTLFCQFRHVIDGHIALWNSGQQANYPTFYQQTIIERVGKCVDTERHVTTQSLCDPHCHTVSYHLCNMLLVRLNTQARPIQGGTQPEQLDRVLELVDQLGRGHVEHDDRKLWAQFAGMSIS